MRTSAIFYKKITRHAHTHHLFGQWKKLRTSIVSVQWFLFRKREMSCPGTCAVPLFYHPTCVGARDFSHGPPLTGSCTLPPLCHPITKILELPLMWWPSLWTSILVTCPKFASFLPELQLSINVPFVSYVASCCVKEAPLSLLLRLLSEWRSSVQATPTIVDWQDRVTLDPPWVKWELSVIV